MIVRAKSYRIGGRDEECDCGRCGMPLYTEDRAYALVVAGEWWGGDAYCSVHCAAPEVERLRVELAAVAVRA